MLKRRPPESAADAINILRELYNLKVLKVTELDAFDGKNFAFEALNQSCFEYKNEKAEGVYKPSAVSNAGCRKCESGHCVEKNVLKIFNNELCTAERLPKTRQQTMTSQFLTQKGFLCPDVIHTVDGELFGRSASGSYTLLMSMLPGQQLGADHSKTTPCVLFELGVLLANLHLALQDADPKYLEVDPTDPWAIENIHLLSHYLHCIKDEEEKHMLSGIIAKFQQIRDEQFHVLQKGIIHGDFHDHNLIVDFTSGDGSLVSQSQAISSGSQSQPICELSEAQHRSVLQKYGIIDFEGMSVSYPVLELCRLIADMMIGCYMVELLDIGAHVIAGYVSVNSAPVKQYHRHVYDTALACLAQYIVLNIHEYQAQGESNDYCMLGTTGCRAVLRKLQGVSPSAVHRVWVNILSSYSIDNVFLC